MAHDASAGYVNNHTKIGIVKVGNEVFIGSGTKIVSHKKDLPSKGVYAGNPAKFICSMEEFKNKHTENLDSKIVFKKPWYKWIYASREEKE